MLCWPGRRGPHSIARNPVIDSTRPDCIGPYTILDVLGEGGMGVVYLAEQREPIRRRVALKVIKLGMDTKEVLARFEAERQALALMDHPNIARVLDAGSTAEGKPFFAMELVKGVTITDYCDRHKLDLAARQRLFVQVCRGIQHAHDQGVIHRDIKPSNVFVTLRDDEPVVKIIDFGVAKATNQRLTERTLFTEEGRLIGTPEYMSPEQAEMTGLDVDGRTDVYSLGVLLYEILTGALPFDAQELRRAGYFEIQRRIREDDPPTPSQRLSKLGELAQAAAERRGCGLRALRSALRSDLDWIVMTALEKDRTRRYRSPGDLADELERHLAGESLVTRPVGTLGRLLRRARRRYGPLFATAGVVVVVGGGIAALLYSVLPNQDHQAQSSAALARDRAADDIMRRVYSESSRGVCLLHGVYRLRMKDQTWLSLDGTEPFEVEYTGSGFLASPAGHILTNRHVAAPWTGEPRITKMLEQGVTPEFLHLTATFPGRAPVAVLTESIKCHGDGLDLAVLRLPPAAVEGVPVLLLHDGPTEAMPDQRAIVIGYPTGLQALLAKADQAVVDELRSQSSDMTTAIARLAAGGLVTPVITQGIIGGVRERLIVFDTSTTHGGSGGPVLGADGTVLAVNYAIQRDFAGANLGVPIRYARELLGP